MVSAKTTRFFLIFLLCLTILGLVFHFTLAAGCVGPDASTAAQRCPVERQNQFFFTGDAPSFLIFSLILPAAPVILWIATLLIQPQAQLRLQPRLFAQDINHPPRLTPTA